MRKCESAPVVDILPEWIRLQTTCIKAYSPFQVTQRHRQGARFPPDSFHVARHRAGLFMSTVQALHTLRRRPSDTTYKQRRHKTTLPQHDLQNAPPRAPSTATEGSPGVGHHLIFGSLWRDPADAAVRHLIALAQPPLFSQPAIRQLPQVHDPRGAGDGNLSRKAMSLAFDGVGQLTNSPKQEMPEVWDCT